MTPQRPQQTASATPLIPATVTAEITGECEGPGRTGLRHRVWIHRDGSITAPDHLSDTDAEQVAKALGDQQANLCHHWLRLNDSAGPRAKTTNGEPHQSLLTWQMPYETFWTPKAQWAALAGILNSITFQPMSPKAALAHAQAYVGAAGRLPSRASDHLVWLSTPWNRQQGGYRRRRATTPAELTALLAAGVPLDDAAIFAVLDIEADTAQQAIRRLRDWGQPPDLFVRLCYALPPTEAQTLIKVLPDDRGHRLPSILSALNSALLDNPDWTHQDVGNFLLNG